MKGRNRKNGLREMGCIMSTTAVKCSHNQENEVGISVEDKWD